MNKVVVAVVVAAAVLITRYFKQPPARKRRQHGAPGQASRPSPPRQKEPDRKADIYFLPVGPLPRRHLAAVETYFRTHTRLNIAVLPMVPVSPEMLDSQRNQLVAEKVITAVLGSLPKITMNPRAVVIGITPMDLFTLEQNWKYIYAKREGSHCTVISSARMTLDAAGNRTDEATYLARIRKMVAKTIGLQYYGLDTNWDHASVMYGNVHGMPDLDKINEDTISRDILTPGERQRQQTRPV